VRRALVYGALIAGVVLVALGPIADGDIYWHVAAGREMLRRGALLRVDPFTLSAAGRPWVDVHWLFQLAAALIHRASGFVGLSVAKAVALAAGAAISTRAAERAGGAVARDVCAAALLGLLFLARHLLPLRPIIVTLLLLAAFLAVLEAHRAGARPRWLLALPLLQIVWVNCQGLSPLGPALVASYLGGGWISAALAGRPREGLRPLRALAVALGLTVLASFATPYGLDAVALPARLLARIGPGADNVFGREIAENVPPLVLDRTSPEAVGHFKWVLAALALALAALRPRLAAAHALVLAGFAGLALLANRNVPLFYWVLAPVGAIALAPRAAEALAALRPPAWLGGRAPARAALAALAAALAGEVALAGVALAREAPIGAPTSFHFPTESARLLARAGASGPIFAPDQHGGYLELAVPALRPYIDTRLILHTAREYRDYLAIFDDPARFAALDETYRFRYVVLGTAYPDRYLALAAHLAADPRWRLLATDGSEVLFGRPGESNVEAMRLDDRATVDAVAAGLDARFATRPAERAAARLNLARTLIVLGQPQQAQRVLAALDSRAAAQLRARACFAAGELAAAEALARVLLAQDPGDTRSLVLLAELALARGDAGEARRALGEALGRDPYDAEARALLARLGAA
jgi:hypothetical protein